VHYEVLVINNGCIINESSTAANLSGCSNTDVHSTIRTTHLCTLLLMCVTDFTGNQMVLCMHC
jgi:hypothetical protein